MTEDAQNALRISQLDAAELDVELFELLKSQLTTAFKYFKPRFISSYGPEINAALRAIIWKFTVSGSESTIGQTLLELRYKNDGGQTQWMSSRQKAFYAILTILVPWLQDRSSELQSKTDGIPHSEKFWKAIEWLSKWWKVLSLANFLIFLVQGRYQYLLERLLGIRAVFRKPQGVRQVGFEYMDRELLWHGFAEFLFFVLPLINFRRITNFVSRSFVSPAGEDVRSGRCPADLKECVVCGEWPTIPHEIGCKHVFCYYCIQSNYLADPSYTCPACGQSVAQDADIRSVKMRIGPPP